MTAYLSYDLSEEKRRLQLQALVLEPLSDRALARIPVREGWSAIDVGCGARGLLPALARRVGQHGRVVGTDLSPAMLDLARATCSEEGLSNVELVADDLFASRLPTSTFDLVHGRFLLAPLGRDAEIAASLERLARPDGFVLLEEPDSRSWRVYADCDTGAHDRLVDAIARMYDRHMGGFCAGTRLHALGRTRGWRDIGFDAQTLGMPPGQPYLRAPLMMATALRAALLRDLSESELDRLVKEAEELYARPELHGVTFALLQVWGRPR
jgi:ubiquinone/menaquinone biosynthesis C-methylase UbiE